MDVGGLSGKICSELFIVGVDVVGILCIPIIFVSTCRSLRENSLNAKWQEIEEKENQH